MLGSDALGARPLAGIDGPFDSHGRERRSCRLPETAIATVATPLGSSPPPPTSRCRRSAREEELAPLPGVQACRAPRPLPDRKRCRQQLPTPNPPMTAGSRHTWRDCATQPGQARGRCCPVVQRASPSARARYRTFAAWSEQHRKERRQCQQIYYSPRIAPELRRHPTVLCGFSWGVAKPEDSERNTVDTRASGCAFSGLSLCLWGLCCADWALVETCVAAEAACKRWGRALPLPLHIMFAGPCRTDRNGPTLGLRRRLLCCQRSPSRTNSNCYQSHSYASSSSALWSGRIRFSSHTWISREPTTRYITRRCGVP